MNIPTSYTNYYANNSISKNLNRFSLDLNNSSFDEIIDSNINVERKNFEKNLPSKILWQVGKIFPNEIWEIIIDFCASDSNFKVKNLLDFKLVCGELNIICNGLYRRKNSVFVNRVKHAEMIAIWNEITNLSENVVLDVEKFRAQINKSTYMKIDFSEISYETGVIKFDGKNGASISYGNVNSIILEILLAKNNFQYLELGMARFGEIKADDFVAQFVEFLKKNKNLNNFGYLNFSGVDLEISHIEKLQQELKGKNFNVIKFNFTPIGEEGINTLKEIFPLSDILDIPGLNIIILKNKIIVDEIKINLVNLKNRINEINREMEESRRRIEGQMENFRSRIRQIRPVTLKVLKNRHHRGNRIQFKKDSH